MSKKVIIIKYSTALFIFLFIFFAHFYLTDYSTYIKQKGWLLPQVASPFATYINNKNIFLGYSYAIAGAFAMLCLFNLITVSGGLKQSIRGIGISALVWLGICFLAGCCGSPMLALYVSIFGTKIIGLIKPIVAGITTITIILTIYYVMRFQNKNLLSGKRNNRGPFLSQNSFKEIKKYKSGNKILETISYILMTLFRLFPNPVPLGLYKFGNPNQNSPVFVTGNYALTFRRVVRALKKIDCYLLVSDSKGINVWCASGAGHFNVQSIVDAIKLSGIEKMVNHRKIILPQFSAIGIGKYELDSKTGWNSFFGPAYIENIKEYINNNFQKDEKLRRAEFGLKQRIEMGVGASLLSSFVTLCIVMFINVNSLIYLIPLIYLQAIIFSIIEPYFKIKLPFVLGFVYSLLTGALILLLNGFHVSVYLITLMITGFYIPNEFIGWSPLVKYSWAMIFKGSLQVKIKVDTEKCIGCRLCVDVCPVNVYEIRNNKSSAVRVDKCEGCKACFLQCPTGAIVHSLQKNNEGCTCAYCAIQDNLQ